MTILDLLVEVAHLKALDKSPLEKELQFSVWDNNREEKVIVNFGYTNYTVKGDKVEISLGQLL